MTSLSISILRNVSGIGMATIRAFQEAGYHTKDDLEGITLQELTRIPGVGEATAEAILEFLDSPAADEPVQVYQHDATRKNIPPAGLASQGKVSEVPATRYFYDPHLAPVLRFDENGETDDLPELLEKAKQRSLTDDEAQTLADALKNHKPWLEWSGKREKCWFDVDPVALHIHERLSAKAIIKLAQRKPLQPSLFADPELEYRKAVQFYEHDVDWTNRLILGDSLTVMHSLAKREDLAGKVQMIYVDPPYGIKFSSNFQPLISKRKVNERQQDITREPEQIKAYRDTWTLGIHSYLSYLFERLEVAKSLLADSGSIFVQISNENLHRVRLIMDEVFGDENFCALITFFKTTSQTSKLLASTSDYLLWYSKDKDKVKYNQIFFQKSLETDSAGVYNKVEFSCGKRRLLNKEERIHPELLPEDAKIFRLDNMTSQSGGETTNFPVNFNGQVLTSGKGYWKTNQEGMERLKKSYRVLPSGSTLAYIRYINDFPVYPIADYWGDTGTGSFTDPKIYVVQTGVKVIERCILMTTDPGDLVLDPTCGSGTTAYVAEQWGRRWITIDTSRVAIALARQRLLTGAFDYYRLSNASRGPEGGFVYKTVPHIMLKTIVQCQALDPIFEKWDPILDEKLTALNATIDDVTPETRMKLGGKLVQKERIEGKRAITEADERRWQLPKDQFKHWDIPFDTDPDWPASLQKALKDYRSAWRQKMDKVNETIAASAPQETLVDQPEVVKNVLRVNGPFTVEGVQPVEESLDLESPIGGEPETLEQTFPVTQDPANAEAYLEKMIQLLKKDGVRFPDNKIVEPDWLDPLPDSVLHAEGEWEMGGETRRLAVAFGPQYGPITAKQVEECLREAYRRGYDDLVFAGFTIDGAAQATIQDDPNPEVRSHLAHIRPDVNMGDLLKDTPSSQLFTVFGLPRVELEENEEGEYIVHMQGVDVYDPVTNTLKPTRASKVAAWFLDGDYNGETFFVTQAFFPDKSAWKKLKKALKSRIKPEKFAAFSSTTSLPFPPGKHKRIAVKVIDPRGNEVMRVISLEKDQSYA